MNLLPYTSTHNVGERARLRAPLKENTETDDEPNTAVLLRPAGARKLCIAVRSCKGKVRGGGGEAEQGYPVSGQESGR